MYRVVFLINSDQMKTLFWFSWFFTGYFLASHHIIMILGMSRFACNAPSEDQRNVIVHEVDGKPCFRTCKDISQGTELLVWPEVQKILNEPVKNKVVTITEEVSKQEAPQRAREDETLKPGYVKQGSEGEGM